MKVYKNGLIYTVDGSRSCAQAFAVDGNKFVYVGSDDGAKAYEWDADEVIDLNGKFVLPGLIDGHAHPIGAAVFNCGLILNDYPDKESLLTAVKQYVADNPDEQSYFGMGWKEAIFAADPNGPTTDLLDEICTDKPIALLSSSCHTCWVNSKAFELAGIDKNTPDPKPGSHFFVRDDEGNPTGYCKEITCIQMIFAGTDYIKGDLVLEKLSELAARYASVGVTSVQDSGCFDFFVQCYNDNLFEYVNKPEFKIRMNTCGLCASSIDTVSQAIDIVRNSKDKYATDKLNCNFLKLIGDGTVENTTAAMPLAYGDKAEPITPSFTEVQVFDSIMAANELGVGFNMHVIGSSANDIFVKAVGRARKAGAKNRITSSHSEYVFEENLPLIKEYGIFCNGTPVWWFTLDSEFEKYIDNVTKALAKPFKSYIDAGIKCGFGSDFPTDTAGFDPRKNFTSGITRKNYTPYGQSGYVYKPDERLTLSELIEGYTINNAYEFQMEDKIGSIEKGKLADFVIFEDNLFELEKTDPELLKEAKIVETVMDGRTTYKYCE